jgi:hypothetical protein
MPWEQTASMAHVMPRICAVTLLVGSAVAHAGTVTGKLGLPASGPPPLRDPGFLDRVENPHMPVKPVDPTPLMVVVLEGSGGEAPAPGQVQWNLLGASFERPLLPVAVGAEVVIKNCRACPPASLSVEKEPDLIQKGAINPIGTKSVKTSKPGVLVVREEELPGLIGRIAVFQSPYFAQPDASGKFEIKDVPAGTYTVKVWYLDHFVERGNETITVENKGKVEVPAMSIPTGFPAGKGAGK